MLRKILANIFSVLACGVVLTVFTSEGYISSELHQTSIQTSRTQDEENEGCELPAPQPNGLFSPSRRRCLPDSDFPPCQMRPGTFVPHNWVLFHSCDPGYILNNTATTVSVCLNGTWKPVLPHCGKLCPTLSPVDVNLKCDFRGKGVACDSETRPDTIASAECHPYYRSSFELRCLDDGSWSMQNRSFQLMSRDDEDDTNPIFRCIQDCGLSSKIEDISESSTPSSTIRAVKAGEYPWVAGIYRKGSEGKWELKCAGTLITPHIVITVAHCVVDKANVKFQPGDIRVGLGKNYRNFYRAEASSGILEVKHVEVHSSFAGFPMFYAYDIALLSLLVEVGASAFIMPACVDWRHAYTPTSGTIVELAGWSKTENGTRTETITATQLKLVGNVDCYKSLEQRIKRYLTADKSCVETLNASESHVGTSGAGVTYIKEGRHFLTGFVSTRIPDQHSRLFISDISFGALAEWLWNATNILEKSHQESISYKRL